MRQISTTSVILKRINYGEADRILTVITPDHGKISLLAKGARKSKSKLAGGLELFSIANITFLDGKSSLKTAVSTQLIHYYGSIVNNIGSTMMAYEFLKLVDTFTQDSCSSEYFDLLENSFKALEEHHEHPDVIFVWFVSDLLKLMGSSINVELQIDGKSFDEDKMYSFSYDDMGFYAHSSGKFSPKHIKFLRLIAKVSKPGNLINISGSRELAHDLRPVLENCLKIAH